MKTPGLSLLIAFAVLTDASAADPVGEAAPVVVIPRAATPRPAPPPLAKPIPGLPALTPLLRQPPPTPAPYQPPPRADGKHVVALDIGHTVAAPGAFSARGRGEFYFNQEIVRLIYAQLEKSPRIAPFIINPEGAPITLPMRTALAARHGAELFLAIHHDSAQDKYLLPWEFEGKRQLYSDLFQGYGVFVSPKNPQPQRSLQFGQLLGAAMKRAGFPFAPHHSELVRGESRRILDEPHGVYEYTDLVVLKTALMPAALLECGVIIHREQELLLREPATQEKIAQAVILAIEEFFRPTAQAAAGCPAN